MCHKHGTSTLTHKHTRHNTSTCTKLTRMHFSFTTDMVASDSGRRLQRVLIAHHCVHVRHSSKCMAPMVPHHDHMYSTASRLTLRSSFSNSTCNSNSNFLNLIITPVRPRMLLGHALLLLLPLRCQVNPHATLLTRQAACYRVAGPLCTATLFALVHPFTTSYLSSCSAVRCCAGHWYTWRPAATATPPPPHLPTRLAYCTLAGHLTPLIDRRRPIWTTGIRRIRLLITYVSSLPLYSIHVRTRSPYRYINDASLLEL